MTLKIFNDIFGDHENIYDEFDLIILTIIYEITKKDNVRYLYSAYSLCQNLENQGLS